MSRNIKKFKEPIKIYCLCEPVYPYQVRYVGKTIKTLKQRLVQHIADIKILKCHRTKWLNKLVKNKLEPIIFTLEDVTEKNWTKKEKWWIKFFKEVGAKLVNGTEGGEGVVNPNKETRLKLIKRNTGRVLSEETKQKIRVGNIGNKNSSGHKVKKKEIDRLIQRNKSRMGEKRSKEQLAKMNAGLKKYWENKRNDL